MTAEQLAHFIAADRGHPNVVQLLRERRYDEKTVKRISDSLRNGLRSTASLRRAAEALNVNPMTFLEPDPDRAKAIATGLLTLQPTPPGGET